MERLKQKLDQAQAKRTQDSPDSESAQSDHQGPAEPESSGRDRKTGRFLGGHPKVGGRVAGTPNAFPRNSHQAYRDLISGHLMKLLKDEEGKEEPRSAAELMCNLILDGLQGRLVLSVDGNKVTYVNPLHALKLYQDYMLKSRELAIKRADAKKKEKGTGGGIRIVLPSVPTDPLLKPGQPPRPLRLLGQDPSKPIEARGDAARDTSTGRSRASHLDSRAPEPGRHGSQSGASTASQQPRSAPENGPRPQVAPVKAPAAPTPESDSLESQLIEDFEYPICQFCMGIGWVRDENGIHMVQCVYCEGKGRAPAPE